MVCTLPLCQAAGCDKAAFKSYCGLWRTPRLQQQALHRRLPRWPDLLKFLFTSVFLLGVFLPQADLS